MDSQGRSEHPCPRRASFGTLLIENPRWLCGELMLVPGGVPTPLSSSCCPVQARSFVRGSQVQESLISAPAIPSLRVLASALGGAGVHVPVWANV